MGWFVGLPITVSGEFQDVSHEKWHHCKIRGIGGQTARIWDDLTLMHFNMVLGIGHRGSYDPVQQVCCFVVHHRWKSRP